MDFSSVFARVVADVGRAAVTWRRMRGAGDHPPAVGSAPAIPPAKPQGSIPTLKMPTAQGWREGQTPLAAPGLKVNAFAAGLKHPRWITVLPNKDVLVAEALMPPFSIGSVFDYAMYSTMKRAAATGTAPTGLPCCVTGTGTARPRPARPSWKVEPAFGMALIGETFYVGNTDGVMAFPYQRGATRITAEGRRLTTFKPGGHWTRSLLPSPDGRKLYAGVGSLTNIADNGLAAEEGRACIYELDLASGTNRIFASGLRNPVGLAWEPSTGVLCTVVNERDGLGDETPPDYLTAVQDGGFTAGPIAIGARQWTTACPECRPGRSSYQAGFALGGHTASLGLCWMPAGTLPGFPDGMAIGQHGSWNRSTLSGYRVVFVPFEHGRPSGPRETS